jgi:hypothetical protein
VDRVAANSRSQSSGLSLCVSVARISQGALEGAIFQRKRCAKAVHIRSENFNPARIDGVEPLFAAHHMQRGAALAAGFCERERAAGKIEASKGVSPSQLCIRRLPMQAAGNHQVQDEPEVAIDADGNPLADPAQGDDGAAFNTGKRRVNGAQQKHARQPHPLQRLTENARFDRRDVSGNVRQLWHCLPECILSAHFGNGHLACSRQSLSSRGDLRQRLECKGFPPGREEAKNSPG